jgi:AcrR family transcriptional regulator
MSRPFRSQQIPNIQEAIKDAAWKVIAESGASALSLRAIARELGITAPAIYNYFPNRDELVTALIVDAYNSLADSQEASVADLPDDDLAGRLFTLGLAYRQWAVDDPQRYQLIFGTPIPHYHAPEEVTLPAAARALLPLIGAIQAVHSAGRLRMKKLAEATPKLAYMLSAWSDASGGAHPEVLYLALVIWSRVHGLVMLEITNNLPAFINKPAEIFQREVKNLIIQYLKSSKGE